MHPQPYPTRPIPEPALHLLGGIWIASCPDLRLPAHQRPHPGPLRTPGRPPAVPGLPPGRHPMTGEGVFIADLEDGCPAAAGWVDYFDHLTLPLTGQDLTDAQATLAGWDDPSSPQGGLGDCWGCAAQVARLRALVDQATQSSREDGPR